MTNNELLPIKVNELLPIGATCIITRLSQASLCVEIFGETDIESYLRVPGQFTDSTCTSVLFWKWEWVKCFRPDAEKWRITVTTENQKLLSPVPLLLDLCLDTSGDVGWVQDIDEEDGFVMIAFSPTGRYWAGCEIIEKRTYPNGQCAPLIEFDEVQAPEIKERN